MKSLLTIEEFELRVPRDSLPTIFNEETSEQELDTPRIEAALLDATGVIVARLLWLVGDNGELIEPVNPKFAQSLFAICADIALYRLTDAVTSSEDSERKHSSTMKLLQEINTEYKGGLAGPGEQISSVVVVPDEEEGIEDTRFFKKGQRF